MTRQKLIVRTSIVGIVTNVLLVIFKMLVGVISGSIAIVLDAVNNLTDVCSSIVTIIGTKLAARRPDAEHPHGHGRYEYLAAMVVGLIVLSAGIMALVESIPKVIHPELASYSVASIVVISSAVIVKFLLGRYVKKVGEKVDSGSLIASGIDAMFDSLISVSTLVGIFVTMVFQISIDGLIGVVIAAFIIKTSIDILSESALDILGRGVNPDLAKQIRRRISQFTDVKGVYDLVLHNYGPSDYVGSVYIEVPDKLTAHEIHQLTRDITHQIYKKYGITLTIGIYAENNASTVQKRIHDIVEHEVEAHPEILQMHGLYIDEDTELVAFDLVVDYKYSDKTQLKRHIIKSLRQAYPKFRYHVTLDMDTDSAK